ncbi:peptidase C39 family protein [Ectothiorhodospiraceae bacterium 2226]|nr:peptidase C39 family protein [Ectothiorhodospiraceae bacterium 2226]
MIRDAILQDAEALLRIELRSFDTDALSLRNFKYLLSEANAHTLVYEEEGRLLGYAIVLFHAGTSHARLYSLAVDPDARRRGIGSALREAAEEAARVEDCISLRVEARRDDPVGSAFFERAGYRPFEQIEDYYEDHMDAVRFEKGLAPRLSPDQVRVPFYQQTLDFTCGPAALLMAMQTLDPDLPVGRKLELRIWRESTTVFMTAGHGGCGPYGLALSAYHRGFDVEVFVKDESALFVDSVRSDEKKEVIRLVQEDFVEEIQSLPIPLHYGSLSFAEMKRRYEEGGIPLVLISSYRIYNEKFPHWVVVTGFDEGYIYVHDPLVDFENDKSVVDSINMPIPLKEFERMARYGKAGQRAVIIVKKRAAAAATSAGTGAH